MKYTFDILGVSPILEFFNHEQGINQKKNRGGVEYIGAYKCTLDALIQSVEPVPPKRGWDLEEVVETVIDFWVNNPESIWYWRDRLEDAGGQNLLVARVGDIKALRAEFESILGFEH